MESELLEKAKARYDHIFKYAGKQAPGLISGSALVKPEWYDEQLILHTRKLYRTYSFIMSRAAFYGLIYGITFHESYIPLVSTGNSANIALLFDRYLSTTLHVKAWYESDMFDPSSKGYKSIKIVRGLHKQVCTQLDALECKGVKDSNNNPENTDKNNNTDTRLQPKCQELFNGVWFSQKDMAATQAAFIGYIATFPEHIGAQTWVEQDFKAFFHFWRVVGYCLGVTDEFNLCSGSVQDTRALCKRISIEYRSKLLSPPISEGHKMGEAILHAFGSEPSVMYRYGATNFLDCDPHTIPLTSRREKFRYATFNFVFHTMAYYPLFLWFMARFTHFFFWLISNNRGLMKKYLTWKYPSDDYKFEPLSSCPMKTKINYKTYTDHGLKL